MRFLSEKLIAHWLDGGLVFDSLRVIGSMDARDIPKLRAFASSHGPFPISAPAASNSVDAIIAAAAP